MCYNSNYKSETGEVKSDGYGKTKTIRLGSS